MQLGLRVNTQPVRSWLNDIQQKHLPFVSALSLTRTAQYARRQIISEMKRQFDRPKPSTVNETSGPLYVKTANYKKPNDYAEVRVKDTPQSKGDPALVYLSHHIRGGARVEKRSEELLRKAGVLPPRYFAVPGSGAVLNAYGNISSGQVQKILSAVGAQRDSLANTPGKSLKAAYARQARRSKGQDDYFVANRNNPRTQHLIEGVWQRYGASRYAIRPVMIFVKGAPRYRKRLNFFEICEATARFRYPIEFHLGMKHALATARVERNPLAPTL